ncbi:MAG: hypothetical protein AAF911_09835 [Planctomycetota bacterium]
MLLTIAQTTDDANDPGLLVDMLMAWGPIVLIAIVIYFLVLKNIKGNSSQVDRYTQHLDFIESKTTELVDVLKEIRDELKRNNPEK